MPLAPGAVADFRFTDDGRFVDVLTDAAATITRAGLAYAWDAVAQRFVTVQANRVPVLPWSNTVVGGRGYAGIIEEGRTNYGLNGAFTLDTGGLATYFSYVAVGTPTSTIVDYGTFKAQRVQYTGEGADANPAIIQNLTGASFSPADAAEFSCLIKGTVASGVTVTLLLGAYTSADVFIASAASVPVTLNAGSFAKVSIPYASLPATAAKLQAAVRFAGCTVGKTVDVQIAAWQIEKGSGATSFIPTTTAVVARPATVVTTPTGYTSAAATIIAVVKTPASTAPISRLWAWVKNSANRISPFYGNGNAQMQSLFTANSISYTPGVTAAAVSTALVTGLSWAVGAPVNRFVNGVYGTATANLADDPDLATTGITVGAYTGATSYWNAQVQRLIIYNKALSEAEVLAMNDVLYGAVSNVKKKMMMGLI